MEDAVVYTKHAHTHTHTALFTRCVDKIHMRSSTKLINIIEPIETAKFCVWFACEFAILRVCFATCV